MTPARYPAPSGAFRNAIITFSSQSITPYSLACALSRFLSLPCSVQQFTGNTAKAMSLLLRLPRALRIPRPQTLAPRLYSTTSGEREPWRRFSKFIQVSEEVQQALAEGKPVVALESAIITHGLSQLPKLSLPLYIYIEKKAVL